MAGIRAQLERFLDFEPGSGAARIVNNLDWLGGVSMLDFLRDVGKHFTVPYMLAKDSVQLASTPGSRTPSSATCSSRRPTSCTCTGRWGSSSRSAAPTSGATSPPASSSSADRDRSRAARRPRRYALSYPLLLDPSGAKFGKTAVGTSVWLDPARTSPYAFYQFSSTGRTREVGKLLRLFTILDRPEIEALEAEQAAHPETPARPARPRAST